MTDTEDRFVDRDRWPPGPWDDEPDRAEWRDETTGMPCIAVRNHMGAWCGYVAVPPGHPCHGAGYDDVDVDVHGGPTYASACSARVCHVPAEGEPDDVWWVGFDTAHGQDVVPMMEALSPSPSFMGSTYKDLAYVQSECAYLARQLADLADPS